MGNLNPLLCWRVKNSQVEKRKQQKNALKEKVEREELHKKKSEYRGEQRCRGRGNIVRHLIITLSNLGLSFPQHLAIRSSSLVTSTGATIKTICGLLNARQLIMTARGERERGGRRLHCFIRPERETISTTHIRFGHTMTTMTIARLRDA